jgi:hypothetical protein
MGYDLVAKRAQRGAVDYYRAGIEFMTFLRSAMLAAGVPEALVYKKFVSNDDWLVTPLQSTMIAEKLTTWLRGRHVTLDLAENNSRAHVSTDALSFVQRAIGHEKDAARFARRRRAKNLPIRLDRKARRALREFAAFCGGSGGFWVD